MCTEASTTRLYSRAYPRKKSPLRRCAFVLAVGVLGCGADARDASLAQPSSPATSIVIAAVELQFEDPSPGGQSVYLANRGTAEQAISCWRITAASSGATAYVKDGTRLLPGRALRFATPTRMLGSPETVTLSDRGGQVVARTPQLSDTAGDDQFWYLLPGESWRFGRIRLPENVTDGQLVSIC